MSQNNFDREDDRGLTLPDLKAYYRDVINKVLTEG